MSVYIYAPVMYTGTKQLIESLNAKRLIKHDGMRFLNKGMPVQFGNDDTIICWGAHVPQIDGVKMLNASNIYINQLAINLNLSKACVGANAHMQVGLPVQRMSDFAYAESLQALQLNGLPKKMPAGYVLPYSEFKGYGSHYYNMTGKCKVGLLHDATILYSDATPVMLEIAKQALKNLSLQFGVVSLGMVGATPVVFKIRTAPDLQPAQVEAVSARLLEWISMQSKTDAIIQDLQNLL